MLLAVILISLFVAPYTQGDELNSRILYGERTDITDFPYFATLENCGAAILSDTWLVTAAHCVATNEQTSGSVWVGGNNKQTSEELMYDRVVIHPGFKIGDPLLPYDIALLRLAEPLNFEESESVQAVALPADYDEDYGSMTYTVAGRGVHEGNLMKIDVTLLSTQECIRHLGLAERIYLYAYRYTFYEKICVKRVTHGNHDMPGLTESASGSPLVQDNVLVGLAIGTVGDPRKSSVSTFTKVARHKEWIQFITGIESNREELVQTQPGKLLSNILHNKVSGK